MNYILVAEQGEAKHIKEQKNTKVIVTGAGAFNVIKTISELLKNDVIKSTDRVFNIGYCGSNISPVGTIHQVSCVCSEFQSGYVEYKPINLCQGDTKCYSNYDFVTQTEHDGIFDMELYTIATFFPNVIAYKIVSDSLNLNQFMDVSVEETWDEMNKILETL